MPMACKACTQGEHAYYMIGTASGFYDDDDAPSGQDLERVLGGLQPNVKQMERESAHPLAFQWAFRPEKGWFADCRFLPSLEILKQCISHSNAVLLLVYHGGS